MSFSSEEQYLVRGNEHEHNVLGSIRRLRDDDEFVDISLVTSDNNDNGSKVLSGHKVVLAACSNFFKKIFQHQSMASSRNPCVFLRGISSEDLAAILDFVYHGEVRVGANQLDSFMAAAAELQIKGLTNRKNAQLTPRNGDGKIGQPSPTSTSIAPAKQRRQSSPARSLSVHSRPRFSNEATQLAAPMPADDLPTVENKSVVKPDPEEFFIKELGPFPEVGNDSLGDVDNSSESVNDFSEHEASKFDPYLYVKKLSSTGPIQAECTVCKAKFVRPISAKVHVVRIHGPAEFYECGFCRKVIRCSYNFRHHLMRAHGLTGRKLIETYGTRVEKEVA